MISWLLVLSCTVVQGREDVQLDSCEVFVPNAVGTSCSNGPDYQFRVLYNCVPKNFELEVYNRWGELRFETDSIYEVWDMQEEEEGVYIWKITGRYEDGTEIDEKGTVVLLSSN